MRAPHSIFCLLLMLVAGCPRPPVTRPNPPPGAEALLAHLRARAAALTSLQASAKADYQDGKNRVKISVSMLATRPDHLRLAGESALTGPLVTLATDGKDFQLLDVQHGRFLAGPAAPCNVARLIRVELAPRDVVDVLLGGIAPLEQPASMSVSWDARDGGREVLTLRNDRGFVQEIRLDAAGQTWDVREAELRDPGGQVLYRVRHEGFAPVPMAQTGVPGARLPAVTYIEDPPHKSDVRLRWRERHLNPDPSLLSVDPVDPTRPQGQSPYHLDPPQGVAIDAATCGG